MQAPIAKAPVEAAPKIVHAPPRRHVAAAHARTHEPAAEPSAPAEPERTVKEGRIVDPFAGMK